MTTYAYIAKSVKKRLDIYKKKLDLDDFEVLFQFPIQYHNKNSFYLIQDYYVDKKLEGNNIDWGASVLIANKKEIKDFTLECYDKKEEKTEIAKVKRFLTKLNDNEKYYLLAVES